MGLIALFNPKQYITSKMRKALSSMHNRISFPLHKPKVHKSLRRLYQRHLEEIEFKKRKEKKMASFINSLPNFYHVGATIAKRNTHNPRLFFAATSRCIQVS